MMELFPNPKGITLGDWMLVMNDVSAHFENDDHFHSYVEGIWNLK
jgi:hypothetical protein